MSRLHLYMFREVLIAFLFTSMAVTFVVLFTQSFKYLSFVIDNAGTAIVFFQLMGLLTPAFLPLIIPLSLGIATLFIYHKFAVDSEIVVMRAAGISPLSLAMPAIALAGMVTLLCYLLTTWITPAANRELVALQYRVRDNFSVFMIRPGAFNDLTDGLTFYANARGSRGELKDILVHDVRNPETPVTIIAQSGSFAMVDDKPQVVVFKGKRQEFNGKNGHLSELNFDQYVLDLNLLRSTANNRVPDPREETMTELLTPPSNTKKIRKPLGHIMAELHQRLAFPLLTLSYAMIALTTVLAGEFNRRGMTKRILAAAAAIIGIQAAALSIGSMISRNAWIAPALYLWAIAAVPVCYGLLKNPALYQKYRHWRARACPLPPPVKP